MNLRVPPKIIGYALITLALTAVSVSVATALLPDGPSTQDVPPTDMQSSSRMVAGREAGLIAEERLTPTTFFREPASDRLPPDLGVVIEYPESVLGTTYEGIFLPERVSAAPNLSALRQRGSFSLIYEDDLAIEVTWSPTATETKAYLDLALAIHVPGFEPYVKPVTINGYQGYALPKLDIPAVPVGSADASTGVGRVKPGTGLATGAASVGWAQGRYAVIVLSEGRSVEDLVDVAEKTNLRAADAESE